MTTGIDLTKYAIGNVAENLQNPLCEQLFEEELREDLARYERGVLTESGAVAVRTGEFTGRSRKVKFIVYDDVSKATCGGRQGRSRTTTSRSRPQSGTS